METDPPSRLTVAVAVAAIIAVIGLLVAGAVLAPEGEPGESDEASLVARAADPHDDGGEEVGAPHDDGTDHVHIESPAAGSPGTTGTTAVHAHDESSSAAATDAHAHDTAPVVVPTPASAPAADAEHAHHDVTTTVPSAPAEVAPPTTVHDHSTPDTTAPDTTGTAVPTGPVITLDDPRLSAAQKTAAQTLLDRTRAAMTQFPDEAAVVAAGYVSIGDGRTGFEHFVNIGYLADDAELDASRIESIVLRVSGGTKTVASAMYIFTTGSTMADVPEIAGELTTWHDHQNLCWDGIRVVAVTRPDGSCPRGEFRSTAPMLHVWLTEQPCGPFSGIEGTHGTTCAAH